jgi:hypothetical protein
MKTLFCLITLTGAFFFSGIRDSYGQASASKSKSQMTPTESLAQKRAIRMKEELFLSNEQFDQIMAINLEMLKKLDRINSQKLDRAEYNKQISQLEFSTKNKIVPLLTPAQRQRFESTLFAKLYETKIDKKRALTTNTKR